MVLSFEQAKEKIKHEGPKNMSNGTKLLLYGYFKQATAGNCNRKKPSILRPTDLAKYNSWVSRVGISKEDAKRIYAQKVEDVLNGKIK
jgi:diazepam-binding inhibitor (GABA receptor modulating acyl-CoA-binding protein)